MRALVLKAFYKSKCCERFNAVSNYTCPKLDVETYWRTIGCMLNIVEYLLNLVLTVLLLHENANPERRFFVSKKGLEKHANGLHEDTIESIRTGKYFLILIQVVGQNNVQCTKILLQLIRYMLRKRKTKRNNNRNIKLKGYS